MMLRLIDIASGAILREMADGTGWVDLPDGSRVSPAMAGWEGGGVLAARPDGEWQSGPPRYRIEAFTPPPPPEPEPPTRWPVDTYRVVRRIAAAGMAAEGRALLAADPEMEMRFLTVGHVWNDDIPMNAALVQLGLDPAAILAPDE